MKKSLLLLFAAFATLLVGCQKEDIEGQEQQEQESLKGMREDKVDGVRYLFDLQYNTAIVKGCSQYHTEAVTIPDTIHYYGEYFKVTSIDD